MLLFIILSCTPTESWGNICSIIIKVSSQLCLGQLHKFYFSVPDYYGPNPWIGCTISTCADIYFSLTLFHAYLFVSLVFLWRIDMVFCATPFSRSSNALFIVYVGFRSEAKASIHRFRFEVKGQGRACGRSLSTKCFWCFKQSLSLPLMDIIYDAHISHWCSMMLYGCGCWCRFYM